MIEARKKGAKRGGSVPFGAVAHEERRFHHDPPAHIGATPATGQ
jgi:hypothetical protein